MVSTYQNPEQSTKIKREIYLIKYFYQWKQNVNEKYKGVKGGLILGKELAGVSQLNISLPTNSYLSIKNSK